MDDEVRGSGIRLREVILSAKACARLFNYRPRFVGAVYAIMQLWLCVWLQTYYGTGHIHTTVHIHTYLLRYTYPQIMYGSLQLQLHALHGCDNRKAFRHPWKDNLPPFAWLVPSDQLPPRAWTHESRQRGVHTLRRDEINAGMMYYARRVCEYRTERENTVLPARFRELWERNAPHRSILAHSIAVREIVRSS